MERCGIRGCNEPASVAVTVKAQGGGEVTLLLCAKHWRRLVSLALKRGDFSLDEVVAVPSRGKHVLHFSSGAAAEEWPESEEIPGGETF